MLAHHLTTPLVEATFIPSKDIRIRGTLYEWSKPRQPFSSFVIEQSALSFITRDNMPKTFLFVRIYLSIVYDDWKSLEKGPAQEEVMLKHSIKQFDESVVCAVEFELWGQICLIHVKNPCVARNGKY